MPEQGFQRCAAGRVEKMTIRSKHNNLLNYFIHDPRDLSPAYVRSCEKFFKSLKPQAPSTTKKPQMIFKTILEFEKDKT
jgi:hypothetical protein